MRITNELNLPQPLVDAITNDPYEKGQCDYSVTMLSRPARIVALSRQNAAHLSEDASQRVFALIGQAIHGILERAASGRYIVEKRYFSAFDGFTVGGQIDVFDLETHILSDYKITSRYAVADGVKEDWLAQASINRLLMQRNGVEVRGAQIVAILRDWSKMEASRKRDYPQQQVAILPVPLWPAAQTEQYICTRIAAHEAAKTELPMCSPEERWMRPTRWATMKRGQKKAVKLHDTEEEAQAHAIQLGDKAFVEKRTGENVRCLHYCPVTAYCDFGRALLEEIA